MGRGQGTSPVELGAIPHTDQEILERVERLADDRGKRYGAEIYRLTNRHLKEFLRTEPQANWDRFNLELDGPDQTSSTENVSGDRYMERVFGVVDSTAN